MKVPQHILRLYVMTARRYKKIFAKLNREGVSPYQRKTFLQKLKKLVRTLRGLEAQLKIAAATGGLLLTLNATPVQAQESEITSALGPFVKQNRLTNPLREQILTGTQPAIALVDHDGDGDLDLVVGEEDNYTDGGPGLLRYFENKSSDAIPLYIERVGEDNPFDGIRATTYAVAPAFADIDLDGDLDLFLGQNGGYVSYNDPSDRGIEYYRNDGGTYTKQTGTWNSVTKTGNPLDQVSLGYNIHPVFIDFDHDSDIDVLVGSTFNTEFPDYIDKYLQYYENDGNGNFTPVEWTLSEVPALYGYAIYPALADMDGDGDFDLVTGSYYDQVLSFYKQISPGNFERQYSAWDPETKTGNPFDGFGVGANASPAFIDFNNDGVLDLFVADYEGDYGYKYSDHVINYYKGNDDGSFKQIDSFENPFEGAFVHEYASPVLLDLDGDQELDALIGNKYTTFEWDYESESNVYTYSTIKYYRKNEGVFGVIPEEEDPFKNLEVDGYFAPSFGDVDGDGDLDMVSGGAAGEVHYFQNVDGVYSPAGNIDPFASINVTYQGQANLVDIDNDGDLDLFMSNGYREFLFFRNDGTPTEPMYVPETANNPLQAASGLASGYTPRLNFTDLDHDGDQDLIFPGIGQSQRMGELIFSENTGTKENPVFENFFWNLWPEADTRAPQTYFIDFDNDGDLDSFVGNSDGTVSYLENQNISVVTTVTGTVVDYENGDDPVIIEPELTLADEDNDDIVLATVTIEDFQQGEKLDFTSHPGISGVFDSGTGVLTFRGKQTIGDYQALLRTVTFEIALNESARPRPSKKSTIAKTISFRVFDQDFTHPQVASKALEIFINDAPTVSAHTVNVIAGESATVDLKEIITDPNGSADLDLTSLKVMEEPASGALTAIDANGMLTIDYEALAFIGTETLTIEVCDLYGACAQNLLTIQVTNTPPVIAPEPVETPAGTTKTFNLLDITSDADGNLNPGAFTITAQPKSGATASIQVVSPTVVNLLLDYENITFHGTDELTIRACDHAGACTESIVEIEVDVDDSPGIVVHNAIAPNSTGDNRFMRVFGLPENHKVTIFSRWGDKVFDTEDYDNNAFKGQNNSGKSLPSGTYFYTIEVPGENMISGYLTLKQ